jgi:hypothetical protein
MGETLRPVTTGFNRSLSIETRAERLTGDPGAVLLREVLDATGNKLADLFIQIKIGLSQDLSIRVSFQIEGYRRALRGYFKRKCCLANLPGSQHVIPLRAEQTPQEKVTFASKAPRRTRYLRAVRLGALRHMEWSILNTGHP